MSAATLVRDAAVATAAGLLGARAMTPATTKLYELQTEEAKRKEAEASYGTAYNVAAQKSAGVVGFELNDDPGAKTGAALHYALAVAWAPVFVWLRRSQRWSPWGAGLAAGTSMYVLVDEVANPLLRFTPRHRRTPSSLTCAASPATSSTA